MGWTRVEEVVVGSNVALPQQVPAGVTRVLWALSFSLLGGMYSPSTNCLRHHAA
jgi:hypothetical protein